MTEAEIQAAIMLRIGAAPGLRVYRNNVGACRDHTGRVVRFGLHQGSGDLIGWRSLVIAPEHVGTTLAQFVSLEVKRPRVGVPAHQQQWAAVVEAAGGLAAVVRSADDAAALLGLP